MNTGRIAALYFCVLFMCTSAHAGAVDDYAYAWPLQTTGDSAAWQVELTPEIYAAISSADLRDVEVVNAAGDAVPLAPHRIPARSTTHETLFDLPLFALPAMSQTSGSGTGDEAIRLRIERGADGRLRRLDADVGVNAAEGADATTRHGDLLLDASAVHEALAGLRIDWDDAATNVNAQFAISASDDLQQWHPLVANATVLRLTQDGNLLDRHEIALNNVRAAYLRLHRLDDGPALPKLSVHARSVSRSTAAQPAWHWLAATLDGSDMKRLDRTLPVGNGQHALAYRYHLPAALAIESMKVELADDNSLARIHVLSREHAGDNDPTVWLQRADFVAFRLRQDDAVIGNDETSTFSAGRARDWRIEAATPLEHAPTLSVAYTPDRFVFLTQGMGPYQLVAGSARARRSDYPVETALAQLRAKSGADWQPPLAALGARVTLQGDSALLAAPVVVQRDWKTWLLWAVLAGAAALIGGLALSLLRGAQSK
jgi:hypothetical protein